MHSRENLSFLLRKRCSCSLAASPCTIRSSNNCVIYKERRRGRMNSWIVSAASCLRWRFCWRRSCHLHHWAFRYRHRAMKPRIACWILITAGPVTWRGRGARLPNTWRSRRRIEPVGEAGVGLSTVGERRGGWGWIVGPFLWRCWCWKAVLKN
jgi:hypothetical protein